MADINEGKIIHSEAEISVDPNCTTAFMTIEPPENGGLDMTVDKALSAVAEKGICFGVMKDEITAAVEELSLIHI